MKSRCDEVRYADEVENLRFRLEMCSNEIPKNRDEVTDVMKSATRMKSKTCVFGWECVVMKSRRIGMKSLT